MPKYLYKILIVLTAVSLLFGSAGLNRVKTARAALPVIETNPLLIIEAIKAVLTEINTYLTQVNTYGILINRIAQLIQQYFEWNFFRNNEKIKLKLFEQVKDQITEKLQTLNDGKPVGIQDYYDYLTDQGLKTLNIFSTELDKNFLCDSFNEQIKQMVKPNVKFSEKGPGGAGCTISDTVSDINAFYDDFSQGGWQAFNQLFEPQNNFFGASLLVSDELAMRQQITYNDVQIEALANQGFYSQRKCEEKDANGKCIKSTILTPGYVFAEMSGKVAYADLDYIPNAGDLTSYLAELGNTFLDRMFEELMGLFKMRTSTEPRPPANDPCAFLKYSINNLYNYCKGLADAGLPAMEAIRKTGLKLIDDLINDKNQALGYYATDQTWVTGLITTLTDLLACQTDHGVSTTDTQAKISAANNQRTLINVEIARINGEILALKAERTTLESLTDQNEIITKIQDINSKYDLTDSLTAQTTGDSITDAWTLAKIDLAACQTATPTPTP